MPVLFVYTGEIVIYEFRCLKCHKGFEVNQPLLAEHKANCPDCGRPAQRIYSLLEWIWEGELYRPDGSRREQSDYSVLKG